MLRYLKPGTDAVGLVSFDTAAEVVSRIAYVESAVPDKEVVRRVNLLCPRGKSLLSCRSITVIHLYLSIAGATNFEKGMNKCYDMMQQWLSDGQEAAPAIENRIIVLTDDMPNLGKNTSGSLLPLVKKMAEKHSIHLSMVGIGLDFNPELIEVS